MARKFDLGRAEAYIRKTGETKTDRRFCMLTGEALVFLQEIRQDPVRGIILLYRYGFAKGKRAQAAAQRKAGA